MSFKTFIDKHINNFGTDWTNKNDVLKAVRNDGLNLQFADYGLRDDFDVVLMAVKKDGSAIQYASRQLRDNYEINEAAYNAPSHNPDLLSNTFLSDRKTALKMAERGFISPYFKDDKDIIMKSMQGTNTIHLIYFRDNVSEKLKSDKAFMMEVIAESPLCFQYISEDLRDDDELAELAIRGWPNQIKYASERIKSSRKFHKLFVTANEEMPGGFSELDAKRKLKEILEGKGY